MRRILLSSLQIPPPVPVMISVEEVRRADQRRRFHEIGRVVFATEPRWPAVLRRYETWLFAPAHPYRRRAAVVRFLARRDGEVAGRICAHHVDGADDGWFGAFECRDDAEVVAALVEAAATWVGERGAQTFSGPATFAVADEAGVLTSGFDHPGGTGRPWHPPWYASHLTAAGLEPVGEPVLRWRLAARGPAIPGMAERGAAPPQAGRLGDRRLVLTGEAGDIAAVPDIAPGLRATGLRAARRGAGRPDEAAIVRLEGDPSRLVPSLLGAAAMAGYAWIWSPYCPEDRPSDTEHRLFGRNLRRDLPR